MICLPRLDIKMHVAIDGFNYQTSRLRNYGILIRGCTIKNVHPLQLLRPYVHLMFLMDDLSYESLSCCIHLLHLLNSGSKLMLHPLTIEASSILLIFF